MFAMRTFLFTILTLYLGTLTVPAQASVSVQQVTPITAVGIQSPLPGQVLQGYFLITGNTEVADFDSYEVYFGYANDQTGTWFIIQRSSSPIQNNMLTPWDTSTITDGDYALRMVVFHIDGSQEIIIVPGLRVRNYTPIETDTPTLQPPSATPATGTPLSLTASPLSTLPPTVTPLPPTLTPLPPTLTPLPTNPAVISTTDIVSTLGMGAGIGLGSLALLGIYLGIRQWQRTPHE